jgi:hypothetical protein
LTVQTNEGIDHDSYTLMACKELGNSPNPEADQALTPGRDA